MISTEIPNIRYLSANYHYENLNIHYRVTPDSPLLLSDQMYSRV